MSDSQEYRIEKDSLGEIQVPADAWYGAQTARAVINFPISGRRPDPDFVMSHVSIKRAAAVANNQPGWLGDQQTQAIIEACDKVLAGEYLEQFVVDRFQAGAGTSHNMNSNEVVANLANAALGGERGVYNPVNPNDHVNMGQSTNDTIPTAIRLAALTKLPRLIAAINAMADEYARIGVAEEDTVKMDFAAGGQVLGGLPRSSLPVGSGRQCRRHRSEYLARLCQPCCG